MDGVEHIFPIFLWGIKNLRRICRGRIHTTCVLEIGENATRGSRLGCIQKGQSETFNEGKQRERNTQTNV